ncbi:MAG TPA: Hsp20/alpha crystallin family protein [Thermodesulfobacteriota bacterium]|nr:Hsp20/alpha crystallin family protein [Thermodesulfobacteriota bacterium]
MAPKDFDQFQEQIHRLMGDLFKDVRPLGYQPDQSFNPPMDIFETEDHLVVIMEIAGMETGNIHVTFEKETLSISGTRAEPPSSPKTRLHQMEIDYGRFQRTLRIPFPLKTDEFRATYRQGFLVVTVPKEKEAAFHKVEVNW